MVYDIYYTNGTRDLSKWFEISQPRPVRSPLLSQIVGPAQANAQPGPWAHRPARSVTNTARQVATPTACRIQPYLGEHHPPSTTRDTCHAQSADPWAFWLTLAEAASAAEHVVAGGGGQLTAPPLTRPRRRRSEKRKEAFESWVKIITKLFQSFFL